MYAEIWRDRTPPLRPIRNPRVLYFAGVFDELQELDQIAAERK